MNLNLQNDADVATNTQLLDVFFSMLISNEFYLLHFFLFSRFCLKYCKNNIILFCLSISFQAGK